VPPSTTRCTNQATATASSSPNKTTVTEYLAAFRVTDHARILACLTDDVEWVIPGMVHRRGKAEFDAEIENDAFTGRPIITETRLTEENDVVIAEGTVQATKRDGGVLNLVFCDVFEMRGAKIRKLTSYLMEVRA
jgi:ketosteroid isomerase-like protein